MPPCSDGLCLCPGLLSLPPPRFPALLPGSPEARDPAAERAAEDDAHGNPHQEAADDFLAAGSARDELQDPVADVEAAEPVGRVCPRRQRRQRIRGRGPRREHVPWRGWRRRRRRGAVAVAVAVEVEVEVCARHGRWFLGPSCARHQARPLLPLPLLARVPVFSGPPSRAEPTRVRQQANVQARCAKRRQKTLD
ncbi:uncharacterized protein MAM_00193 [Metarhizium album ARSEF 1941]|uniref:Uncharacterized protein n=1 Tax=Metarhizium album (strain ARSEF 1941) TaxID=1081103 RepID=A0A0B2WY35_METAS|nr:uncharacterized protein MAM_00193 [Metarhizium album ARSEF 1941]KHO01192.1 hypothetical protein MAM_00193 [Metarhizium album ARSEF 1941]